MINFELVGNLPVDRERQNTIYSNIHVLELKSTVTWPLTVRLLKKNQQVSQGPVDVTARCFHDAYSYSSVLFDRYANKFVQRQGPGTDQAWSYTGSAHKFLNKKKIVHIMRNSRAAYNELTNTKKKNVGQIRIDPEPAPANPASIG